MKICKIHGYLKEVQVKCGVYKGKPYRKCRQCENERAKKYAEKNREKLREKDRKYWAEHKEEISEKRREPERLERRREWGKENYERYADYYREKQAKYNAELADPYIKKVIQNGNKNIAMRDIPPVMIELQRAIMTVNRRIREKRITDKIGLVNNEN